MEGNLDVVYTEKLCCHNAISRTNSMVLQNPDSHAIGWRVCQMVQLVFPMGATSVQPASSYGKCNCHNQSDYVAISPASAARNNIFQQLWQLVELQWWHLVVWAWWSTALLHNNRPVHHWCFVALQIGKNQLVQWHHQSAPQEHWVLASLSLLQLQPLQVFGIAKIVHLCGSLLSCSGNTSQQSCRGMRCWLGITCINMGTTNKQQLTMKQPQRRQHPFFDPQRKLTTINSCNNFVAMQSISTTAVLPSPLHCSVMRTTMLPL